MAVTAPFLRPDQAVIGFVLVVQDETGIQIHSGIDGMAEHSGRDALTMFVKAAAADITGAVKSIPSLINEPARRPR